MGTPLSLDTIVIPTCERPAALQRAAESYLANAARFGHKPELVVCDDSRTTQSGARNVEVLRELRTRHGISVRYAGAEDKKAFTKQLTRESGVPDPIVDFALNDPYGVGYGFGGNQNFGLLETTGRLVLSVDDDTICEPRGASEGFESFVRSKLMDPTGIWPAESLESIRASLPSANLDVLGVLDRWLGKGLKDGTRVRMCLPGLAGDCGARSPFFLFRLEGERFDELVKDSAAYRRILESRQIVRRVERLTITRGGFCQTTFVGLDNRELLPPFLPVLRCQDFIFSRMLELGIANTSIFYFPFCLTHAPVEARAYTREDHRLAAGRRNILDIFLYLIKNVLRPDAEARGLEGLGSALREHVSTKEFGGFMRSWSVTDSAQKSRFYRKLLQDKPGAPDYWKDDVAILADEFAELAKKNEYVPPEELAHFGSEKAQALVRSILSDYGALLEAWPTLVAAARRLRERGVTPARDLA